MSCSRERLLSAEGGAERAEAEQDSPEEERALLGGLQRTVGRFSSRLLALGAGAGTAGAEYLKRMLATPEGTQQVLPAAQGNDSTKNAF